MGVFWKIIYFKICFHFKKLKNVRKNKDKNKYKLFYNHNKLSENYIWKQVNTFWNNEYRYLNESPCKSRI